MNNENNFKPIITLLDKINKPRFKGYIHIKYNTCEVYIKPRSIKENLSFENLTVLYYKILYRVGTKGNSDVYVDNVASVNKNELVEIVYSIPQKFLIKCLDNAGKKIAKLEKQCEINSKALTSLNKEWTRFTVVTYDMVGHTFSVYDGSGFIPVKVTHSMIGKPLIQCIKQANNKESKND